MTEPQVFSFRELVFSDLLRIRGDIRPSWPRVLSRCLTTPGMIASLILRAQQSLDRAGRVRYSQMLRVLGNVLLGSDFCGGVHIGRGLLLPHPNGITIGYGLRVGDNVSMAAGATCAARYYDGRGRQDYPTICDGAVIGAHAVLVGGVTIGRNAMVGANSVVLADVPDNTVVLGVPAVKVGTRDATEVPTAPEAG